MSEFVHTQPRQLPPRYDLRKLHTEPTEEEKELQEQKSEGRPEQERMVKMKSTVTYVQNTPTKGFSAVAVRSRVRSWLDENLNSLMKVSTTEEGTERVFKVGDKVQLQTRGPSDSSIQALKAEVLDVYPKTRTLRLKAYNGVEVWASFDEVFSQQDVEF